MTNQKRKIGTNPFHHTDVDIIKQFPYLKEIGFDSVMLNYFEGDPIGELFDAAVAAGLEVSNIHAPISTVNSVWLEGADGDRYIDIQKERVDFCHATGIPIIVIHTTFLKNPPPVSQIGLDRTRRLCEYAGEKGVRLAFENVEPYPHLAEVMKGIGSFHGFCWDIGHNRAYAPNIDFSELYGHCLAAVHIHDNLGMTACGNMNSADDRHWLPMDGTTDWVWYKKRLNEVGYTGPLSLEQSVLNSEAYKAMGFEKLASTAFERMAWLNSL